MNLYDFLEVDFSLKNKKGKLLQLVHEGYKQINIVSTFAGEGRGGHYHRYTEEAFYIVNGSVEVLMYNDEKSEKVVFNEDDFFIIHPYVVHDMVFLEDTVMVALYSNPVELPDGEKDIIIVG